MQLRVGSVGSSGIPAEAARLSEFRLLVQVIVEENNVFEFNQSNRFGFCHRI